MPSVQYTPSIHGPYGTKKMLRRNRVATDQAGVVCKVNSVTALRLAETSAPGTRRSTRLRGGRSVARVQAGRYVRSLRRGLQGARESELRRLQADRRWPCQQTQRAHIERHPGHAVAHTDH